MASRFRLLIQNCGLPPPVKIYRGFRGEIEERKTEGNCCREDEKLGLLKALRLSQTRAREAEKRGQCLAKERDMVCNGLMRESLRASAYRNWVRILELQVSVLKSRLNRQEDDDKEEATEEEGIVMDWAISLGIALGIASTGIALAWRHQF